MTTYERGGCVKPIIMLIAIAMPSFAMAAENAPKFYGDGIHDDGPALEAAAHGDGFIFWDEAHKIRAAPGYVSIINARITLCRSLDLRGLHLEVLNSDVTVPDETANDEWNETNVYLNTRSSTIALFFEGAVEPVFAGVRFIGGKECGRPGS